MSMRPAAKTKRVNFRILVAFSAIASITACAETQLGAQAVKSVIRASSSDEGKPSAADSALAPEQFEATGLTLWDGAATLQGVWIAHPLADKSQRVRVYNEENGLSVQGAMFRRDPGVAGPSILVSSDAARKLGLKPNDPTELRIIALQDGQAALGQDGSQKNAPIQEAALSPESANAAHQTGSPEAGLAAGTESTEQAVPSGSSLPETAASDTLPPGEYVQVGSFSSEVNAARLVERLKDQQQPARYVNRSIKGKSYSIVVIGPLNDADAESRAFSAARDEEINDAVRVTL